MCLMSRRFHGGKFDDIHVRRGNHKFVTMVIRNFKNEEDEDGIICVVCQKHRWLRFLDDLM